jgi:FMN phosphatase YigB (HAD superfamily)
VIGKPHRPIFEMALERMGLVPDRAAMVGDSLETDIAGGRDAGMATVWVAPEGERRRPPEAPVVVRDLRELLEVWNGDRH